MNFHRNGDCQDIYLSAVNGDITNPASYGVCDVQHADLITWNMANGVAYEFDFVSEFTADHNAIINTNGISVEGEVIARYVDDSSSYSAFLWVTCKQWEGGSFNAYGDEPWVPKWMTG